MNQLAQELNAVLKDTSAYRLLSELGRRLYFPKGIIAQSVEAGKAAKRFNATIGLSTENGKPMILPSVAAFTPGLTPAEAVSYAPVTGDAELRKLWKDEMLKKNPGLTAEGCSLPVVVPGLTAGISTVADLFVNKDDVVVIPDMFWDNYELIFGDRLQAKLVPFPFFTEAGGLNVAAIEDAILKNASRGKVILLLNFPNNPAGYSPKKSETKAVAEAIRACADRGIDILVISDDAYYGLFYEEGTETESLFSVMSSLHERVLAAKVDGSTKEDYVWGFRVAFLTFGSKGLRQEHYEALNVKVSGNIRTVVSSSSRLAQSIMIKAMKSPTYHEEKRQKAEILRGRYAEVRKILKTRTSGKALEVIPFNSGYFMSFRCEGISAEKLRQKLLERGIGTISLQDKFLRIAFASIEASGMKELYEEIFRAADELAGTR